jgi:hypothetical protein
MDVMYKQRNKMKSKVNFKEKSSASEKSNRSTEISREIVDRAVEAYLCDGGTITKLRKEEHDIEDKATNDVDITNNRFGYLFDYKFET